MNEMPRINADLMSAVKRDDLLTARIAEYLADQNNDPMCRFYKLQAEEIMAMVRESDRNARRILSPYAVDEVA